MLLDTVTAIGLKVSIVTGWELPTGFFRKILDDQLTKFFLEKYPTVNMNEVDYAFRNFTAKEWGKQLNLVLIDEVLSQYMEKRFAASAAEEVKKAPQLSAPAQTNEEKIADSYECWKIMPKVDFILNCYDALRATGKMEQPTAAMRLHYGQNATAKEKQLLEKDPDYFKNLDWTEWRKNFIQKLAVNDYFKSLEI